MFFAQKSAEVYIWRTPSLLVRKMAVLDNFSWLRTFFMDSP